MMTRTVNDNPGGISRSLPSDAVESGASYSLPWLTQIDVDIAAGAEASNLHTIADPDYIYYLDMVSITPQVYTEFSVRLLMGVYVFFQKHGVGWINLNARPLPQAVFIDGDIINAKIVNRDTSTRSFIIIMNGSKVIRPASWTL